MKGSERRIEKKKDSKKRHRERSGDYGKLMRIKRERDRERELRVNIGRENIEVLIPLLWGPCEAQEVSEA